MENFFYKVNGVEYPVIIIHKRIKNIHYRFVDNSFHVSCHPLTRKKLVLDGLDKYGPKLVRRGIKEPPIGDDYMYLFGVRVSLSDSGSINFTNGESIVYKNREDLQKKLKKFYLRIILERVAYYSAIMHAPVYRVSVKNMKSRFGSNSMHTQRLHFATCLMHYSYDIIDSVIVHEIAHIFEYNHSKKFYDVVYKYCPNYDLCRKKLIRGEYQ